MGKYRFIGSHADSLDSGQPIEPGQFVELDDDEIRLPHNEALAADGFLIGVEEEAEHEQKLASRRSSTRERKATEGEEES